MIGHKAQTDVYMVNKTALWFFSFVLLGKDFIIIPFTFQGVTKGARNKILLSIKKLSERPETLNRLEKVKFDFDSPEPTKIRTRSF